MLACARHGYFTLCGKIANNDRRARLAGPWASGQKENATPMLHQWGVRAAKGAVAATRWGELSDRPTAASHGLRHLVASCWYPVW